LVFEPGGGTISTSAFLVWHEDKKFMRYSTALGEDDSINRTSVINGVNMSDDFLRTQFELMYVNKYGGKERIEK
jgi:hypothetical protein